MPTFQQFIGGEWRNASNDGTWDLIDPATERSLGEMPYGNGDDATAAIDAAAAAFPAWANTNPYRRAAILTRAAAIAAERRDECARITTEESGKPLAQASGEWTTFDSFLTFMSEEAKRVGGRIIPSSRRGRRTDVTYMPIGVVGVITAWNFPVYNPIRAAAAAMAAGCSVVVRPSEFTPRSAMLMAEILHDAGLPPGVFNVINGEPEPMGQVMLDDARVRKIQFTGSVRVGRLLMDGASRTMTRLSLELGGNAPVLVFPDADIEAVAASGIVSKYRNGGQVCVAPQRFFVHSDVVDDFTTAAKDAAEAQVVGHGLDPDTTIGPMINSGQRDRVAGIVRDSIASGARLLTGGSVPDGPGFFYTPTVMTDVPPDAPALTEEIFGPVMPVIPFDDIDAAIEAANSVRVGLASYVWTKDLETALRVSEQLEFGLVGVNDWNPQSTEAPFGGMKQSGLGREAGQEGLLEYLEPKTRVIGVSF
jgi:acyl-CoA reductase-like NAD-dependent aldehyde dehydrogenase